MKIIEKYNYLVLFSLLMLTACNSEKKESAEKENEAEKLIAAVEQEYAPDSRVALFEVEAVDKGEKYVLKGESNLEKAVAALKTDLENADITFVDSIQILPSEALEGKTQGVIEISVANLRSKPQHSSQLVTQATLGTPVKILKKDGSWFYIQTPVGYLAWTDYGGVKPLNKEEFKTWHSADKLIYLEPFGFSYSEPNPDSQVVSDLVAGDILVLLGKENDFFKVKYPDGKTAFIEKNKAQPYLEWVASLKDQNRKDFVETAKSLMGLPYLWGGTSPKGVDCSGFTKTVYFLNGIILPRDASQQVVTGKLVDTTKTFENLLPGDLLFFGRPATDTTPERIIHVGMWIGDNKFIHSMGDVHISTFDTTAADFDEYNYNRYLKSKRLLGQEDEKLIQLTQSELFIAKSDPKVSRENTEK